MRDEKPDRNSQDLGEDPLARLSPSMRRDMQALEEREDEILRLLADPKNAEAFLSDPVAVLQAGGIEVPPTLRRRLQRLDPELAQHLRRQTYVLPNGQTVTARIKVNFTRRRREGRDAG